MITKKFPGLVLSMPEKGCNIVFVEFDANLRVDLKAAREIVAHRIDFTENKKVYLVADMSNIRHVTSEAKEFLQSIEGGLKNILGAALIASNPVSALIANIFIKSPKNFQARFFSNKLDASTWIVEHSKISGNKIMRIA
jgi:hypothetical protein